jgi:hypothetical protein
MNPAIVGALIGAIPGTLAAGLTTWAAVRAGYVNLEQTRQALKADHDRWLREKRADVYVDLLRFVREADRNRFLLLRSQEATDDIRHSVQARRDVYVTPETQELFAQGAAYASDEAYAAFAKTWRSDQKVWRLASKSLETGYLDIDHELDEAMADADKKFNDFRLIVRHDLQETSGRGELPSDDAWRQVKRTLQARDQQFSGVKTALTSIRSGNRSGAALGYSNCGGLQRSGPTGI